MPIEIGPADRPSRRGVAERSGMAGPASGCCNAAAPNGVEEQNDPATAPCISPRHEIANGTAIQLTTVAWSGLRIVIICLLCLFRHRGKGDWKSTRLNS